MRNCKRPRALRDERRAGRGDYIRFGSGDFIRPAREEGLQLFLRVLRRVLDAAGAHVPAGVASQTHNRYDRPGVMCSTCQSDWCTEIDGFRNLTKIDCLDDFDESGSKVEEAAPLQALREAMQRM